MTAKINIVFEDFSGIFIAEREVEFDKVAYASIIQFRGKFYIYNQSKQKGLKQATFNQVDDPIEIT